MEKRRLGTTDQYSSLIVLGGIAFANISQLESDRIIKLALDNGVNHFDVAPSYGDSELRIAPWLKNHKNSIFLADKTAKRTRLDSKKDLDSSLKRLNVNSVDLYQLHAIETIEDVELALDNDGAMETLLEAKEQGLTKYIGVTGHDPKALFEIISKCKLDTLMCPVNFILDYYHDRSRDFKPVIKLARSKGMGVLAIKAIAKKRCSTSSKKYRTWYEPFDVQSSINNSIKYTLSQDVDSAVTAGDINLFTLILNAAKQFTPGNSDELNDILSSASSFEPIFPRLGNEY